MLFRSTLFPIKSSCTWFTLMSVHYVLFHVQSMSAEEKRGEDRRLWLCWLARYRERLQLEAEGEDVEKVRKY